MAKLKTGIRGFDELVDGHGVHIRWLPFEVTRKGIKLVVAKE